MYIISGYYSQYTTMITDQLTTMITDEGDAVQFLASVTTVSAFENRPLQNPSVTNLIEHALKSEIQTTAKNGAYSGKTGCSLLKQLAITMK